MTTRSLSQLLSMAKSANARFPLLDLSESEEILLANAFELHLTKLAQKLTGASKATRNEMRQTAVSFSKALSQATKNELHPIGFGYFDSRYLALLMPRRCNEIGLQICKYFALTHESLRQIELANTPRKVK